MGSGRQERVANEMEVREMGRNTIPCQKNHLGTLFVVPSNNQPTLALSDNLQSGVYTVTNGGNG